MIARRDQDLVVPQRTASSTVPALHRTRARRLPLGASATGSKARTSSTIASLGEFTARTLPPTASA